MKGAGLYANVEDVCVCVCVGGCFIHSVMRVLLTCGYGGGVSPNYSISPPPPVHPPPNRAHVLSM